MSAKEFSISIREGVAAAFLLAAITWLALHYQALPASIHSPFNGGGDATGKGNRDQLWLLVVIAGWIYALMSMINLMPPEAVNWPSPVTDIERQAMLDRVKVGMGWFKAAMMAALFFWIVLLVRRT